MTTPPSTQVENNGPNKSTSKTLEEMRAFIDTVYPINESDRTLRGINVRVHEAFKRYKEAVSRPNPVYAYINEHLQEGFSEDEIKIFVAGLQTRVVPTAAVLGMQDCFLRAAGLHDSHSIIQNFSEEAGGQKGRKSHVELFFAEFAEKVSAAMARASKDQSASAKRKYDMQFHPLAFEAARLTIDYYNQNGKYPALGGDISRYISREGIVTGATHAIASVAWPQVSTPSSINAKRQNAAFKQFLLQSGRTLDMEADRKLNKPLNPEANRLDGWNLRRLPQDCIVSGATGFAAGTSLARLIPHSLMEYGKKIWENQMELMREGPQSTGAQLKSILALLTREQNADKGSHIEAALKFADAYTGGSKWATIHVGDMVGVEGDHADDARTLFMTLLTAAHVQPQTANADVYQRIANDLVAAFDYVVEKDYCALQQAHMDAMVEGMKAARTKALEKGDSAFIKPVPKSAEEGKTLTNFPSFGLAKPFVYYAARYDGGDAARAR